MRAEYERKRGKTSSNPILFFRYTTDDMQTGNTHTHTHMAKEKKFSIAN